MSVHVIFSAIKRMKWGGGPDLAFLTDLDPSPSSSKNKTCYAPCVSCDQLFLEPDDRRSFEIDISPIDASPVRKARRSLFHAWRAFNGTRGFCVHPQSASHTLKPLRLSRGTYSLEVLLRNSLVHLVAAGPLVLSAGGCVEYWEDVG